MQNSEDIIPYFLYSLYDSVMFQRDIARPKVQINAKYDLVLLFEQISDYLFSSPSEKLPVSEFLDC